MVGNVLTSIAVPLPHSPKAILFRAWLARIGEFWASHKSPAPFQRPSTKIVRIPRLLCRMLHCKWIFYAYNIKIYMIILKALWPTFSISGCPCGTVFRNVVTGSIQLNLHWRSIYAEKIEKIFTINRNVIAQSSKYRTIFKVRKDQFNFSIGYAGLQLDGA